MRISVLSIMAMAVIMMLPDCNGCNNNGGKGDSVADTAAPPDDTGGSAEEETGDLPCPADTAPGEFFLAEIEQTNGKPLPEELIDDDEYTYYDGGEIEIRRVSPFGLELCIDRVDMSFFCTEGVVDKEKEGYTFQSSKDGGELSTSYVCYQNLGDPDTGDYGPQPYTYGTTTFFQGVKTWKVKPGYGVALAEIKAGYKYRP